MIVLSQNDCFRGSPRVAAKSDAGTVAASLTEIALDMVMQVTLLQVAAKFGPPCASAMEGSVSFAELSVGASAAAGA
jgi:hypothetical protein